MLPRGVIDASRWFFKNYGYCHRNSVGNRQFKADSSIKPLMQQLIGGEAFKLSGVKLNGVEKEELNMFVNELNAIDLIHFNCFNRSEVENKC